jgi:hypothetical protein
MDAEELGYQEYLNQQMSEAYEARVLAQYDNPRD